MRYGISVWNYVDEGKPLGDLVTELADMGFTAMSFSQNQILGLSAREADDLKHLLEERDLIATVHGACHATAEQIQTIFRGLGKTIRCFTVDPFMNTNSRGSFYDAPTMAAALLEASRCSDEVFVAIEDFPLDDEAVSFYHESIMALLKNSNYGILVDIGHMNFRCRRKGASFNGMNPLQYLSPIPVPIVEVHLHDNMGDKDSHGHFGFGNLDLPSVAEALKKVGFKGVSTIEVAPSFHGSTPQQSKPFLKPSLDTWRALWESDGGL